MKQILVDMDGVLADVYHQFQSFEKRESGKEIPADNLLGKPEEEAFPNGKKHVRTKGFFREAPIIPGSTAGLEYLDKHYHVYIVSAAMKFPQSLEEKYDWMQEHYPFISWEQIIFCGDKKAIEGDIMIDDHPKNLKFFDGKRIIFAQPHNSLVDEDSYKRVHNWNELMNYF